MVTFTDPIIVYPRGREDTLPDWPKNVITLEILVMNIMADKGKELIGTDAEMYTYLCVVLATQKLFARDSPSSYSSTIIHYPED